MSILSLIIICLILYSSYNLYYEPEIKFTDNSNIDVDLLKQLDYLEKSLADSIAYEMQEDYPEGFFFSNLLYGLTWCEFGKNLPEESALKKRAIKESLESLAQLESDFSKSIFDKNLSLPYGAFHFSWTNYLRAKILTLSNNFVDRKVLANHFTENCFKISTAINKSASPFPETYINKHWPADIVPAIAALSLHDKLFQPRYNKTIETWITNVEARRIKNKCLFPHEVDSTGSAIENERGSSISLILILLPDISEVIAKEQIQSYMKNYVTDLLFLPMIKESSDEYEDYEDVDSGPVILGYGSVATILGAGVFKRNGMLKVSTKMFQTIECIGFPYKDSKYKKYLAGLFPMADFFIAWTKSLNSPENISVTSETSSTWRLTFHFASMTVVGLLIALVLKLMKKQKN